MPTAALRVCRCGAIQPCPKHTYKRWAHHTTSRHERGYGTAWDTARRKQLRTHPWCDCGEKATHVDHWIPKHMGGTDDPSNLHSMCKQCESTKTAHDGNRSRRTR